MNLQSVVSTLKCCLAIFKQSYQCRQCGPCTRGQSDIRAAIDTLERLIQGSPALAANRPSVQYVLERKGTHVEFFDRPTLLQFVRDFLPSTLVLLDESSNGEIARMAATRNWVLEQYQPGEYVEPKVLLQLALNTVQELLLTTELNMDDLEAETRQAILRAGDFENLAALHGFFHEVTKQPLL